MEKLAAKELKIIIFHTNANVIKVLKPRSAQQVNGFSAWKMSFGSVRVVAWGGGEEGINLIQTEVWIDEKLVRKARIHLAQHDYLPRALIFSYHALIIQKIIANPKKKRATCP